MADLIYNPLLKKGFQEINDTSEVEAEIDDLRQKKVTKFFSASDNIENDEIAQYQGEDDVAHGLKFGLFYVQSGTEITLPEGTQYFENIDTVNLFGYDVRPGDFYLVENITPAAETGFTSYRGLQYESARDYLFVNKQWPQIGESVWDVVNQVVLTVTDVNSDLDITLSNGVIITSSSSASSQPFNVMYHFIDINNNNYSVVRLSGLGAWLFVHYSLEGGIFSIENFFAVRWTGLLTSLLPIVITNKVFTQTDTQPRVSGISNDEGGGVAISTDVTITGNLTVQGTQTVVQTQEIDSENDNINLRYNNPLALADGEESGVKVLNYDGNNTNCFLGVDNQGWARVGDEGGNLQKLATIEESPTNNALVKYNTETKQLESTTVSPATTSAAGLMSAADKVKLNGIAQGAQVNPGAATTTAAGLMSAADKVKLNGIAQGAQVNPTPSSVTTYSGNGGNCQAIKYGNLVTLYCTSSNTSSYTFTLASTFRPIYDVYERGITFNTTNTGDFEIKANGSCTFKGIGSCVITYITTN